MCVSVHVVCVSVHVCMCAFGVCACVHVVSVCVREREGGRESGREERMTVQLFVCGVCGPEKSLVVH